ncbi:MAG: HlyC/CorC family transporter [Pseudomonadota bacterium]|nr:HlyC/CorC family transporter [Pseudomonadota bacterium]
MEPVDISIFDFELTPFWTFLSIVGLLVISAFFSGSETALTGASKAILRTMSDKGSKGAAKALRLRAENEKLIGSLLLGNNLVNILAASLATSFLTKYFQDGGVVMATITMTLLVLIFSEVLPKTYAITNPEFTASKVSKLVNFFVILFSPFVTAIRKIVQIILWIFGINIDPNQKVLAEEEIAGTIALHHSEGSVEKDARDRLLGALDLGDRAVDEIMLHRSQIEMIDSRTPPNEILSQCLNSPYTRIPVFQENPENVIGVLHAKDLLREVDLLVRGTNEGLKNLEVLNILKIIMKPYFIPETTTLDEQMQQFLKRKSHFALVVDEYGALRGLITLEDILEEIVGQIADEHDLPQEQVLPSSDGSIIVDGNMSIRDLNRARDWNLSDDEANTLAGLVIHEAQTIPTIGQVFSFNGFRYEVLSKEKNRLTRIKIKKLDV